MPNDQSKEKINTLKHLGAEVVLTRRLLHGWKKLYQLSRKIAKREEQFGQISLTI